MSKTQKFLDYILNSKSRTTFKQYRLSISLFTEYYNETHESKASSDDFIDMRKKDFLSEDVEQQRRFHREIERFYKWMRNGKKDNEGNWIREPFELNSARNNTIGMIQFFKYYGYLTNVSFPTVVTTKDFIPTIQQYRDMFNVADLRARVILSMGLDLGWRIGDFLKIEKDALPDLNQEPPISVDTVTQKCNIVEKSFLSAETVELLKTYLPTLKAENPFLFQSNSHSSLDPETIGDILKALAEKARIFIPKGKRLRFHCFRKRFLSTCADLKIDVNTAKLLVGKDVEKSMLTYLSEVEHRKAFIEVKEVLTLSNGTVKSTVQMKDVEIEKLKKQIEELKLTLRGLTEILGGPELYQKALQKLGMASRPLTPEEKEKLDPTEVLAEVARRTEKKQQEEYRKLIESNNGNGNGNH